jgi:hypothetical protein
MGDGRWVNGTVNFGVRCDSGRHLESEKVRERASFAERRGDRPPGSRNRGAASLAKGFRLGYDCAFRYPSA